MTDDPSLFDWAFKGLVGALFTIGGSLWVMLVRAVGKTREDLIEHKLHVANNYVKKDVVDKIHEKMDNMAENISEIKTMLITELGKRG